MAWAVASANAHESTFTAALIDGSALCRVGADERPRPVLALGRAMVPALDSRRLPERDDRGAPVLALAVDALDVVARSIATVSGAKPRPSEWRCPTGGCKPASRWVTADRLHPLVPRGTKRFEKRYGPDWSIEGSNPSPSARIAKPCSGGQSELRPSRGALPWRRLRGELEQRGGHLLRCVLLDEVTCLLKAGCASVG